MYFDRFLEADERTAKFGLGEKKMKKIELFYSQSHLSSKFEDFLFKVMPMNNLNILSRNCLAVNLALIEKIKGHFQCDASYTIGYVEYSGKPIFKKTEGELSIIMQDKSRKNEANLHAWITLDSFEIIDLTILTTMANYLNEDSIRGQIIFENPDTLKNGLSYFPMLTSAKYLAASGLVHIKSA